MLTLLFFFEGSIYKFRRHKNEKYIEVKSKIQHRLFDRTTAYAAVYGIYMMSMA